MKNTPTDNVGPSKSAIRQAQYGLHRDFPTSDDYR
jgi:hypothetical protein